MSTQENADDTFEVFGRFKGGVAKARQKGGKMLHVHPDGKPAYESRFDWVGDFKEKVAVANLNGENFLIDLKGERIK